MNSIASENLKDEERKQKREDRSDDRKELQKDEIMLVTRCKFAK